MTKAVFFDMNETLLNLGLLNRQFVKHFDDEHVLKYWFTKLLHSSTIMGIMDEYRNFGELAEAALESLFFEYHKPLSEEIKTEILGHFRKLPPYNDVQPALTLLRETGIRTIAVSNSSLAMIKEQLSNAGIIHLFDAYYSVDQVKKYKPFKDVYHWAAKQEGLMPQEVVMVATHDWDLSGAKKAGLTTAYIKRKETIYHPYYPKPDLMDTNLVDLMHQIINTKK